MTCCKLQILLSIKFTLFTFSFAISQTPKKCKRESEPKEKNLRLLQHPTIKKQMSEEKQSTKPEKLSPEIHVFIFLLNNVTACSPVFLFVCHLFFNFLPSLL